MFFVSNINKAISKWRITRKQSVQTKSSLYHAILIATASAVTLLLNNFVSHLFVTSVKLPQGPLLPHRNKWNWHLSVGWSSRTNFNGPFLSGYFNCVHIVIPSPIHHSKQEKKTFPNPLSHGLIVKKSKEARWCLPNFLQKFSASDLASFCLNIDQKNFFECCASRVAFR